MKLLTATAIALLLSGLLLLSWIYWVNPQDFVGNMSSPLALLLFLGPLILSIISFGLARVPMKRINTRVLAALFVICALSVPATILYAQETAVIGCLGCSNTGTGIPMIGTGSILVPYGSGNGTLSVQLRSTDSPLIAITFSNDGLANMTTIPNVGSMVMLYQGRPVSPVNPLPVGVTASASLQISNATAGVTYELNVEGVLQNGGHFTQTFSITAQL